MVSAEVTTSDRLPVEQRRAAAPQHVDVLRRRAAPAMFVVDEDLNVLFYREDPRERRVDYRVDPRELRLPAFIEQTVRELIQRKIEDRVDGSVMSVAPNGSIVVRAIWLCGPSASSIAVLVERLQTRDHINSLAKFYSLSGREREVLALVVRGARNNEIAEKLFIAHSTAIFHVKRLLEKTNSRNRTELVAKVIG
ncbi:MAG TPA: LuxR C-terminal-related transcriptional regulator [Candidatus Baltobacteraceae bacterium]|jgi:DNA-binding CsgD family transcriptional regulator